VAFALSLAVPAMAVHFGSLATGPTPAVDEGFSISGSYTLDAERYVSRANTGDRAWFDDDLEVVLKVNKGDVTAVVDLEVSDDENFDGTGANGLRPNDLIDNYWVTFDNFVTDGLSLKIGEYSVSFGKKVVFYAEGNHLIGLKYGLDSFDLGLYLAKQDETKTDPETDEDLTIFTAGVKGVDFFKKLNLIFATASDETAGGYDYGYTGIDTAFDLGPIPLTVEYGAISDDDPSGNDGGTFYVLTANFKELVNFNLGVEYYSGNEDMGEATFGGNDYYPLMIYGFRSGDNGGFDDVNLAILTAGYKYSDNLSLKAKVLVQGEEGSTQGNGSVGTEIDIHGIVKLASNASATLTYATWAPGDAYAAPDDDTSTDLRARLKLTF